MNDIKMVVGVVIGSAILVFLMIFGLSKMSSGNAVGVKVNQDEILAGALLTKQTGETKVTVVDFSDVQCPACKVADQYLKPFRDLNGVKFVYRHFPLPIHKNATVGARAVEAARQLGKPWEMIDILFDKQDDWGLENNPDVKFSGYAKTIGLNETDFMKAYKSSETAATVSADLALGDRLQLSGTPSIFVNGELTATQFVVDKVNQLLKQ